MPRTADTYTRRHRDGAGVWRSIPLELARFQCLLEIHPFCSLAFLLLVSALPPPPPPVGAALPPLFTQRNPRRACHARCIVVLSGAISLSVSQGHRNPWCALTCPPTSRTSRTTPQRRAHISRHALRLLDFKNLVHPPPRKTFLFFCVHPQSARTATSLTFPFFFSTPPFFYPLFLFSFLSFFFLFYGRLFLWFIDADRRWLL